MAASRPALRSGYTSRAMMRQAQPLMTTPRMPRRWGGLQSVTSRPKRRCQRSSMGAASTVTAMPHAANWNPRLPERPNTRIVPVPRHVSRASMPKDRMTAALTPAYVMRCGGIQNESRPMTTCHWMSHWTPQPATTFEASSAHRTTRLRLTASAGARTASKGRSLARTLTWLRLLRRRRLGRLHRDDLDVEEQRLASKGMIQIQHHRTVLHGLHGHRARLAVLPTGEEPCADHVGALGQRVLGHLGLCLGIDHAVGLVGLHRDLLRVTSLHAEERLVETGNDLMGALNEGDGLLALAGVENLALVVLQRVLHLDRRALFDGGTGLCPRGRSGQQHQQRHQGTEETHGPSSIERS